jgi:BolA protein
MFNRSILKLNIIFKNMSTQTKGPIEVIINSKLTSSLSPTHIDVINESYKHNVAKGSESHFKVVIVSNEFEGKSPILRHRLVNTILKEELANDIHALSIQAKTQSQWDKDSNVVNTPNCLGGSGK